MSYRLLLLKRICRSQVNGSDLRSDVLSTHRFKSDSTQLEPKCSKTYKNKFLVELIFI